MFWEVTVTPGFGDIIQLCLKEQPDITIHRGTFDIMQLEHFSDRMESLEMKSRVDAKFRVTGDEEFDIRDLVHVA